MANWIKIVNKDDIPQMGSRILNYQDTEIAIFKTREEEVFAVNNTCPHKQGKLADGLVHDNNVTCPLHNWVINLEDGQAQGNDEGCTNTYETKVEDNFIYIKL